MPRRKNAAVVSISPASPELPPASPWDTLRLALAPKLSHGSAEVWLTPTAYSHQENGTMFVRTPNTTFKTWLDQNAAGFIRDILLQNPGGVSRVEFITPPAPVEVAEPEAEPEEAAAAVPLSQQCPQIPEAAWCPLAKHYLAAVGGCTEASDNYHFACFLSAAGIAFNRSFHFTMARRIYPNFFVAIVGGSGGARKGTAQRYATDLATGAAPDLLHLQSVDSREGLIQRLYEWQSRHEKPSVACLIELEEFRQLIEKSRIEGVANIVPTLANAFDCPDRLEKNTVQAIAAKLPTVAMMGGADPNWLERMKVEDLKGGMGNRILWIPGEPKKRMANPPAPDLSAIIAALQDIRRFWTEQGSTEITWTPEAFERWKPFYEEDLRHMQSTEPLLEVMAERMHVHAVKTAMLYAALDRSKQIALRHLEAAIALVRFLIESLAYIFQEFGLDWIVKQERQILRYIEAAGSAGITRRTLQKKVWRIDTETFNRRLRWMTAEDGPVRQGQDGRSVRLWLNK